MVFLQYWELLKVMVVLSTSTAKREEAANLKFICQHKIQQKLVEETETELPQGNGELILVVDDEAAIRDITKTSLESHNYKAITASDGIEAIALYVEHRDEISLVLTDMVMPSMDGYHHHSNLAKN